MKLPLVAPIIIFAFAIACVRTAWATPDENSGGPVGSAQHVSYAASDALTGNTPGLAESVTGAESEGPSIFTGASGGALVIMPTFDSSITGDANAAAIEAMINDAIAAYESLFNDPITVSILFRYSTTLPDGSHMPSGALALSISTIYAEPWTTYIGSLEADATTANDATANASLPGSSLSTNILAASADGRALGLATPPAMFADGSVGAGGPYDGIVTINSAQPFKFTRPPATGKFDALRTTEHEMDEVLGLGSFIGTGSDLRPQDLFSWSAPGTRKLTSSGTRYFSIDGGTTDIVGFNQKSSGDFGDWLSGSCPQATPFVQNAFSCANQASDVTDSSPEGINLDVIGYDLLTTTTTPTTTTTTTTIIAAVGHLECYKTKDQRPKPPTPYTLDLLPGHAAGFPNTLGCSLKFGAKHVCVEVDKQNVNPTPPGGGPVAPSNAGSVFLSYKIKCPKQAVAPAALVDQFGPGSFAVGVPSELLVPALPGPANDHYECYKVKDVRPKASYTMDLIAGVAGFTNELGCSIRLGAKEACIEVVKQNVNPTPPGGGPGPGPGADAKFLSYKLKCPTPFLPADGITDQFGAGTFTPAKPSLLLVPAS